MNINIEIPEWLPLVVGLGLWSFIIGSVVIGLLTGEIKT